MERTDHDLLLPEKQRLGAAGIKDNTSNKVNPALGTVTENVRDKGSARNLRLMSPDAPENVNHVAVLSTYIVAAEERVNTDGTK